MNDAAIGNHYWRWLMLFFCDLLWTENRAGVDTNKKKALNVQFGYMSKLRERTHERWQTENKVLVHIKKWSWGDHLEYAEVFGKALGFHWT